MQRPSSIRVKIQLLNSFDPELPAVIRNWTSEGESSIPDPMLLPLLLLQPSSS
jgi:hypothetical protein